MTELSRMALNMIAGVQPFVEHFDARAKNLDRKLGALRVRFGFAGVGEALGARMQSLNDKMLKAQRGRG